LSQLTVVLRGTVKPDWVDYNGHMGDYAYGIVFSDAVTAFMDMIGINATHRNETLQTVYLLEWRIAFLQECHEGQSFRVEQQLLDLDSKRFHGFYRMVDETSGEQLAICEQLLMHMQQQKNGPPKSSVFPAEVFAKLDGYYQPQKELSWPAWVGGKLGIRRKG
jgi:acyl-CoA thioester hydrolase